MKGKKESRCWLCVWNLKSPPLRLKDPLLTPLKEKQRSNAWLLKKDIIYMAASLLMVPLCSVIWLSIYHRTKKIFKEKINWDHFSLALNPHIKHIFSWRISRVLLIKDVDAPISLYAPSLVVKDEKENTGAFSLQ